MAKQNSPSKTLKGFLEPGETIAHSARANLKLPGHRFKRIGVATVTDQRFLYEDPGPAWAAFLFGWIVLLLRGPKMHATDLGEVTSATSEKKGWQHYHVNIDVGENRLGTLSVTDPEPWIIALGRTQPEHPG